jgi:hypothetical protein
MSFGTFFSRRFAISFSARRTIARRLALWLASHHVSGDKDATRTLLNQLLEQHLAQVDGLVAVNALLIGATV